ncbi:M50 family metallopeptidase [Bounagaea algeriensis]
MLVVVGIVIFFLGLLFSIAWHELGHLATAKMFGVKVTQYMVGFGRTLWSRRIGETEYGVKAIPLGGYIRMIGMFPPKKDEEYGRTASSAPWRVMIEDARQMSAEEVRPEDSHRQFYQRKPWKRIIVMLAGPAMNLILAVGVFTALLMGHGIPQPTTTVGEVSECVVSADVQDRSNCPPGAPPSPAAAADMRAGDRIVEFNGQPVSSWEHLQRAIRDSHGAADLVVERDGQRVPLQANLMQSEQRSLNDPDETVRVGFLGVQPTQPYVRQDFGEVVGAIGQYVSITAEKVVQLPQRVPDLVQAIGGGEREQDSPVGIVGASRLGGEVLSSEQLDGRASVMLLFNLLAGVNLSLFVFNLLPLLPLDGGHVFGAAWESIRRRFNQLLRRPDPGAFDTAKLMPIAYGFSMVLIAFSLLLAVADIVNPVRLF